MNYSRTQKLSWFGHVHRMTNDRLVTKLCVCHPISAGLAGRPKIKWENNVEEELRIMKINNWTKCMQGRVK